MNPFDWFCYICTGIIFFSSMIAVTIHILDYGITKLFKAFNAYECLLDYALNRKEYKKWKRSKFNERQKRVRKKIKNKQYNGIGCKCAAYGENECACDADWTPLKEIELELKVLELEEENTKLLAEVAGYKHDLIGIRDALDEDGGFKNTVNGINKNLTPNKKADAILGCVKALEKIVKVSPSDFIEEIGVVCTSEHYEACWLKCSDIAKEALSKVKGAE